ncbi:MarR family winged helix-turn-helix transcriptional regulator [Streptomyces sp. NPDC059944]|uniref:MarR family winged helix-turn-helix transcriptional regulator n=1 Tax=unclassified Streptomyces TaxID=2593676 RepID=UPI003651C231
MNERIHPTTEVAHAASQQVRAIAELLDVLWEQDRNEGPPPYLPVSQLRVLHIVDREHGIRMRTLTRLLGAAPPSVSRLIDRLQALGFVERRPCPDSRRELILCLTQAGRRHLLQVRERREHLLLNAIDTMPGHQHATLTESLAGLQQALADQPMLRLTAHDAPLPTTARSTARSA